MNKKQEDKIVNRVIERLQNKKTNKWGIKNNCEIKKYIKDNGYINITGVINDICWDKNAKLFVVNSRIGVLINKNIFIEIPTLQTGILHEDTFNAVSSVVRHTSGVLNKLKYGACAISWFGDGVCSVFDRYEKRYFDNSNLSDFDEWEVIINICE